MQRPTLQSTVGSERVGDEVLIVWRVVVLAPEDASDAFLDNGLVVAVGSTFLWIDFITKLLRNQLLMSCIKCLTSGLMGPALEVKRVSKKDLQRDQMQETD
jgi:hypothetical protein